MSADGLKLVFLFDKAKYHKQKNPIPSLSFACPTIQRKVVSTDVKFCHAFWRYLNSEYQYELEPFRHSGNDYESSRYYDIIKNPMDFETLGRNLRSGRYETKEEFKRDMDLIWSNYILYTNRGDQCKKIQGQIECLWQAHALSLDSQRAFVAEMDKARSVSNREFNINLPTNEIFKSAKRLELRRCVFPERKRDRPKPERKPVEIKELEPEPEQEDTEIDSEQRLELAVDINQLPRPLLARVIDILETNKYLNMDDIMKGETVEIPFSKIDDRTLKSLQREVKRKNKDKEKLREFFEQDRYDKGLPQLDAKKLLEEQRRLINEYAGRDLSKSQMTDGGTDISDGGSITEWSSDESSD